MDFNSRVVPVFMLRLLALSGASNKSHRQRKSMLPKKLVTDSAQCVCILYNV